MSLLTGHPVILSLSDSGGMIVSTLRINPSAMYSSALRLKYGLRPGSALVHLPVCIAVASFASTLSFAVSSLTLSSTTACSDWTAGITYFSRRSVPVSGSGCLDVISHVAFPGDVDHLEVEVLLFQG